ncbi:hybrid sensor histidine kinase/response regulator [Limnofasciculus baicalensis]|uniref:hybrid sensor histidine kinase/response regulator n=1 Tax=Limnofasciculus baicalensis TaxID=3064906 RepID=UPI0021127665|nr:response regulator [Limnofasciculus baicalensis]
MIPAKILVVDDEVDLESLLRQRLRKKIRAKEFELIFARSGKEALQKIKSDRTIDMVLTDLSMPEMDGLTLLNKLREIDENIKAVVISAFGDLKNIRAAMNCGAFDFITKPIDFDDLIITINKTLAYVKQIRETLFRLQQAQLQLIQHEKMAVLGQLVAGLAHEMNNPLASIKGSIFLVNDAAQKLITYLQLYQEQFPNSCNEIAEYAEDINLDHIINSLPRMLVVMGGSTDRLIAISNSLRTFSRGDTESKVLANIHDGIDSTIMILQHRMKANSKSPGIRIVKEYGDIPNIKCYLGQLNQVFMNIIVNGIDACEEDNLNRSFEEIEANPNRIVVKTKLTKDKQGVVIEIQDNGTGMTEEVKSRMFEQLFTTKPVGKGTGFGLSISRRIVEEIHGGSLNCTSVLGKGTEFAIAIPIGE